MRRAVLGASVLLALLVACADPPRPFARPSLTVRVGPDDLRFTLAGPDLPAGERAEVSLFGPAGETVTRAGTQAGQVTLRVPSVRAGAVPFEVRVGPHRFEGQVRREPGEPVSPLTLKVGGRAVRVTQPRPPALVLHPTDRHGNVTRRPVTVRMERPDGVTLRRAVPVKHLTAWVFLPPGRVTGLMSVTAVTGGAAGESGEVDLLPGPLSRARPEEAAGRWAELRDRLGNRVVENEAAVLTAVDDGWNVQVPFTPVAGAATPAVLPPGARVEAEEVPFAER